jgi:hypothetical protein
MNLKNFWLSLLAAGTLGTTASAQNPLPATEIILKDARGPVKDAQNAAKNTDTLELSPEKGIAVKENTKWKLTWNLYWFWEFYAQTKNPNNRSTYQFPNKSWLNVAMLWLQSDFQVWYTLQKLWFKNITTDIALQVWDYVNSNYTWPDTSLTRHIHNCFAQINMKWWLHARWWIFGSSWIWDWSTLWVNPQDWSVNNPVNHFNQWMENIPYYITWWAIGKTFINKDSSQIIVEVWVTNWAQHIQDNNDQVWVWWNAQYTFPQGQKTYLCFHYSDEGTWGDVNKQLIIEWHGTFKIKWRQITPAAYVVNKNEWTRSVLSLTASKKLSENLLLWARAEGVIDPNSVIQKNIWSLWWTVNLQRQDPKKNFTANIYAWVTATNAKVFPQVWVSASYRLNEPFKCKKMRKKALNKVN